MELAKNPLFLLGLVLRIGLIAFVLPHIQTLWFIPFLQTAGNAFTLDPWSLHLNSGGDPLAFPYGFIMYFSFLPATIVGLWLEHAIGTTGLIQLGFSTTILLFDLLLLLILRRIHQNREKQVMILYWLSPVTLFICYWHGQNDIVPITLLALALAYLKRRNSTSAGIFSALAVSAKLGMLLPLPIIMLYTWRKGGWESLMRFLRTFLPLSLILTAPFFLLDGLRATVLQSPEINKLFFASLTISPGMKVYLMPIIYAVLTYLVIKIRRVDFSLLISLTGLSFLSLLLLAPTSVGWYLWVAPFLISYYVRNTTNAVITLMLHVAAFSFQAIAATGASLRWSTADFTMPLINFLSLNDHILSLWLSGSVISGGLLFIAMIQHGVFSNYAFKLSKQPIMIGITGDSGVGKDTLSQALSQLFYKQDVVSVFGDDYHRWERNSPEWKHYTHLDPAANNLSKFYTDIKRLRDGKAIMNRSYDHKTGLFTAPLFIKQRDLVIAFGLHTLFLPTLRKLFDVKIFMEMDEGLRRYFKIRRDMSERGHSIKKIMASIQRREPDANAFIKPQKRHADVVFHLSPANALPKKFDMSYTPELALTIKLNRVVANDEVLNRLREFCTLKQHYARREPIGSTEITLKDIRLTAVDNAAIAYDLFPYFRQILAATPLWQGGTLGIMQLFTIMCLYDRRK